MLLKLLDRRGAALPSILLRLQLASWRGHERNQPDPFHPLNSKNQPLFLLSLLEHRAPKFHSGGNDLLAESYLEFVHLGIESDE